MFTIRVQTVIVFLVRVKISIDHGTGQDTRLLPADIELGHTPLWPIIQATFDVHIRVQTVIVSLVRELSDVCAVRKNRLIMSRFSYEGSRLIVIASTLSMVLLKAQIHNRVNRFQNGVPR